MQCVWTCRTVMAPVTEKWFKKRKRRFLVLQKQCYIVHFDVRSPNRSPSSDSNSLQHFAEFLRPTRTLDQSTGTLVSIHQNSCFNPPEPLVSFHRTPGSVHQNSGSLSGLRFHSTRALDPSTELLFHSTINLVSFYQKSG